MSNEDILQAAIQAARSGDRDRARTLFIQVLRQDSKCFPAWLWLSEFGKTPEEQAIALERAQAHCPPNAEGQRVLREHLNRMRGAIPARGVDPSPAEVFARAEKLARAGKSEAAVRLLTRLVKDEPQDERARRLLNELSTGMQEKQRAEAINPQDAAALEQQKAPPQKAESPLQRGLYLEEAGEYAQAASVYQLVITHSRVPTERLEARRRIANIELHQESEKAQPIHPTLNLARVTLGPVLLFGLMVFIQSGLNLLHTPLLAIPGIATVLAGSFLVSVTTMRPMHPRWIALYGTPGEGEEPRMRGRLRLAGWFCMLAPYSIFLIDASFRLGALRASMLQGLP